MSAALGSETTGSGGTSTPLAELVASPAAAVAVEDRYGALLNNQHVQPGWLLELVARLQVRYPSVPIAPTSSTARGQAVA